MSIDQQGLYILTKLLYFVNRTCAILLSIALIGGLMVVTVSCASDSKPIETEADFTGFITEIHPNQNNGISGQVSVESHADKIVAKYSITIKNETLIFLQDGDNLYRVAFTTLETKQRVHIWLSGPILDRVLWLKDGEIEIETRSETSPALKAHKGNELATARVLHKLTNLTIDRRLISQ